MGACASKILKEEACHFMDKVINHEGIIKANETIVFDHLDSNAETTTFDFHNIS